MAKIEGSCRELCDATEFVAAVTIGDDGPHVVGNWGEHMRAFGFSDDRIVFPAARYHKTEQNLQKNNRIHLMMASTKVQGSRFPGQGGVLSGRGEVVTSGEIADVVKAKFPWARGALVIHVDDVQMQL